MKIIFDPKDFIPDRPDEEPEFMSNDEQDAYDDWQQHLEDLAMDER